MSGAARRLAAEAVGTAFLLAVVVGSGIMAERLSPDSDAVALLANALATGAGLFGLILVLGPVSGGHFNPAVTLVAALRRELGWSLAGGYMVVQIAAAGLGVLLAHAMFDQPLLQVSERLRTSPGLVLSEFIATFGLVLVILGCTRARPAATPGAVALYIVSAYWFTASTAFANPAVTIARMLTESFAGIAPGSAPYFIAAQFAGALAAAGLGGRLFRQVARIASPGDRR